MNSDGILDLSNIIDKELIKSLIRKKHNYDRIIFNDNITDLWLDNCDIKSLNGLIFPKQLIELKIINNLIKSLKNCDKLPRTIKYLCIDDNRITSLEYCEELPQEITVLEINNNRITSLMHCEKLPQEINTFNIIKNCILYIFRTIIKKC